MMSLSYNEIVKKISEEKGLSEEQIASQIKEKLSKFSDLISKEGAAHILANELGVKIFEDARKRTIPIGKLLAGMRNISVIGKVTRLYEVRSYKTKREGKVASLMLGDSTGTIRTVLWDTAHIAEIENGNLKEGTVLKIDNVYMKENNGFHEIHVGSASKMTLNPEGETVDAVSRQMSAQFSFKHIKDLQENDSNIMIRGTVVQAFEPRFYQTCSVCNKKATAKDDGYYCDEHGKVKETWVPIMNVFLDDGTDNIRVVAFRDQASQILKMSMDEILSMRTNPEKFEALKNNILGSQFTVNGRVSKNEMYGRVEFVARNVEVLNPEKLAEEMAANA